MSHCATGRNEGMVRRTTQSENFPKTVIKGKEVKLLKYEIVSIVAVANFFTKTVHKDNKRENFLT